VRLVNANVEQSVIGGTVRLPTSGAIPPGLWVHDEPPGPDDVVAVYAPLRAVRDGWSGLEGRGWVLDRREDRPDGRDHFFFSAQLTWFPASGCGAGLRLQMTVTAMSRAKEGRSRRGFRYSLSGQGPMRPDSIGWVDRDGNPVERPLPQVQIMAPPRVRRMSDFDERVEWLPAVEAEHWAAGSRTPGLFRTARQLQGRPVQEHTPAGRGITLLPIEMPLGQAQRWLRRFFTGQDHMVCRVRVTNPFTCAWPAWRKQRAAIAREAADLGMAMATEAMVEWWCDRYGYDALIFTDARRRYEVDRVLIVFRRSQVVEVK
jgi:hypothetical protein